MGIVHEEFYHGWVIQVSQDQVGYTFQCWTSTEQVRVTDDQSHSKFEQALGAGRLQADLESLRLSLTSFLRGKLKLLFLYPDEQDALENSISQYIDRVKHQVS